MHQLKLAVSGAQILFVAFGALVLVPLLTGLNPAMALLGAGVGTLFICLYRPHHLRQPNLGHGRHHVWLVLRGLHVFCVRLDDTFWRH